MKRRFAALALAASLALPARAADTVRVSGLDELVVGRHEVRLEVADENVVKVEWGMPGYKKISRVPQVRGDHKVFSAELEFAPTPVPQSINIVAYDASDRVLYRLAPVVNPGEMGSSLEFLHPIPEPVADVRVEVCAKASPGKSIDQVVLSTDKTTVPMQPSGTCGRGMRYSARTSLADQQYISARILIDDRVEVERSMMLGVATVHDEIDVQVLSVYAQLHGRNHAPALAASERDIIIREDGSHRPVKEVRRLADGAPLRIGILYDLSPSTMDDAGAESMLPTEMIDRLLSSEKDIAFVGAIAHVPIWSLDWSSDKRMVSQTLLGLRGFSFPRTAFNDTVFEALYKFQGQDSYRAINALVILSDGMNCPPGKESGCNREEGIMRDALLRYAEESNVRIYPIAVEPPPIVANGYLVRRLPNKELLDQLSASTGSFSSYVRVKTSVEEELRKLLNAHTALLKERNRRDGGDPVRIAELERAFAAARASYMPLLKQQEDEVQAQLPDIYRRIEDDLRSQYLIVYDSGVTARRNTLHSVEVLVTDAGRRAGIDHAHGRSSFRW